MIFLAGCEPQRDVASASSVDEAKLADRRGLEIRRLEQRGYVAVDAPELSDRGRRAIQIALPEGARARDWMYHLERGDGGYRVQLAMLPTKDRDSSAVGEDTGLWVADPSIDATTSLKSLGVAFVVPDGFVVGRFAAREDRDGFFGDAAVLIRREIVEANELALDRLPVGEYPNISLHRITRDHAEFILRLTRDQMIYSRELGSRGDQPILELDIGRHKVLKLPYWPGPFGDQTFVYLIEVSDGYSILMLAGRSHQLTPEHKRASWPQRPKNSPTNFDLAIEQAIATLTILPPPATHHAP